MRWFRILVVVKVLLGERQVKSFIHSHAYNPLRIRQHESKHPPFPVVCQARSIKNTVLHVQAAETIEASQVSIPGSTAYHLRTFASGIHHFSNNPKDYKKPIRSLQGYLCAEHNLDSENPGHLEDAVSRAVVAAIRSAVANDDYRCIRNIVDASIVFCKDHHVLSPRVFREAVSGLSKTSGNVSKLKQMWQLAVDAEPIMSEPLGAHDLNTMLKALGSRNKIRAVLGLYQSTSIEYDSYTATTVLRCLKDSVARLRPTVARESSGESPCWQFEEGMELLRGFPKKSLDVFVFCSALELNSCVAEVFNRPPCLHDGVQGALSIVAHMKSVQVPPNNFIFSILLSQFAETGRWKAAVALLDEMEKPQTGKDWQLPKPNEFIYSWVISTCARCGEHDMALSLLDRMESRTLHSTYAYNAVLSALAQESHHSPDRTLRCMETALFVMQKMMKESGSTSLHAGPNLFTFNTLLSVMRGKGTWKRKHDGSIIHEHGTSDGDNWDPAENLVAEIFQLMDTWGVLGDELTFHNAIKASRSNSETIFHLLSMFMKDHISTTRLEETPEYNTQVANAKEPVFVFNSALLVFAQSGSLDLVKRLLGAMKQNGVEQNDETVSHLIIALGKSGKIEQQVLLLRALHKDQHAQSQLYDQLGIMVSENIRIESAWMTEIYEKSISCCLAAGDVKNALEVVAFMKSKGENPSQSSLEAISFAYARLATKLASACTTSDGTDGENDMMKAQAMAQRSLRVALETRNPSAKLMASICACFYASELFDKGHGLLQTIHQQLLEERDFGSAEQLRSEVKALHRKLFKICASRGKDMAVLGVARSIVELSSRLEPSTEIKNMTAGSDLLDNLTPLASSSEAYRNDTEIGMTVENWALLMVAASKSGHWRLCLHTLNSIRPLLEGTNPSLNLDAALQDERYSQLSKTITAAMMCFETMKLPRTALRAIIDWMKWTGRRPPSIAVLCCMRVLAKDQRGSDVKTLLHQLLALPRDADNANQEDDAQNCEDSMFYIQGITCLFNNGLYQDADEVYVQAVSSGHLIFELVSEKENSYSLDLHGMNVAVAHSAVRTAFQEDVLQKASAGSVGDLIIITGRGANSFYEMVPVLRPEVQRLLTEEFYPPLNSVTIPGNLGALRVPASDVESWVLHQQQQQAAKMLAVANAIKSISVQRLKKAVEASIKSREIAGNGKNKNSDKE